MAKGSSVQSPQEFRSASDNAGENTAGIEQSETVTVIDSGTLDPAKIDAIRTEQGSGSITGDGSVKKRRGRPPGRKAQAESRSEKTGQALDIEALNKLIYNSHILIAKVLKKPELQLDKEEAQQLAEATANLGRHYNIVVSQRTMDHINFISTASAIYGTRIFAIINNKHQEKVAPTQKPPIVSPSVFKPTSPPQNNFTRTAPTPEEVARARAMVDNIVAGNA